MDHGQWPELLLAMVHGLSTINHSPTGTSHLGMKPHQPPGYWTHI